MVSPFYTPTGLAFPFVRSEVEVPIVFKHEVHHVWLDDAASQYTYELPAVLDGRAVRKHTYFGVGLFGPSQGSMALPARSFPTLRPSLKLRFWRIGRGPPTSAAFGDSVVGA